MSRLDKESNSTDPSVEFIVTAAKLLNTNLDILANDNLTEMTPTEEYLLGLIKSFISDTKADQINWEKETETMLTDIGFSYQPVEAYHPLFDIYMEMGGGGYPEPAGTKYHSSFTPGEEVKIAGNCYHGCLPNTESYVYIMKLLDSESFIGFYEMYLVSQDENDSYIVDPICSSREICEPIETIVKALYKEIEIASSHVHLNMRARSTLEQYMSVKRG